MTNEELYYSILRKKYNILKKNLIIIEQTKDKVEEFRNTIVEIDKIEQEKFKKEISLKKELTTNLEDEYKRLYNIINLIEERNRRRENMLEDYDNIVKDTISDLEPIEEYNDLEFYNNRLDDINEYLNNDEKYNKYIEEKNNYINLKSEDQEKYDILNKQLDEFNLNLLIKLKNSINSNNMYNDLDFDNLDESINSFSYDLEEKEKELNTYLYSYDALSGANITDGEKDDYNKFISEEKKDYLENLEKKYILLLYKYINENDNENALTIYNERLEKIEKFNLENNHDLDDIFGLIKNYIDKKSELKDLELTLESINNNIEQVDSRIEQVKIELNAPNIINLLKEFCIEKDYIDSDKKNDDEKEEINFINDFYKVDEEKVDESGDNEEILIKEFNDVSDKDIEVIENIIESPNESNELESLSFDYKENDSVTSELETDKLLEIKGNSIKEVKDLPQYLLIENIREKALKVMKSVCESVI